MDILSAIIIFVIWGFIGSAIKKNAQRRPGGNKPSGIPRTPVRPEAPQPTTPVTPAAAPKDAETARREARDRLEKNKRAYTPVSIPKSEGEGTDVTNKEHTVQPSFAPGAHAHEETSMTGFKPCPPEQAPAHKKPAPKKAPRTAPDPEPTPAPAAAPAYAFAFTKEDAVRAIIYSEILAKPKALR